MEEPRKKRVWPLVLAVLLAGMFFYFVTASPSKPRGENIVANPAEDLTSEEAALQINEESIKYLVFSLGGWKLHNPPLSDETPKIKVVVDDEVYFSEIVNGEISAEKKEIDNEDITIKTTKKELAGAIKSLSIKDYIKNSVQEGKTTLELKASYTTLFSKGYLSIYKDITGKSFTGSAVRIFSQG
jgi:hypothetical protein